VLLVRIRRCRVLLARPVWMVLSVLRVLSVLPGWTEPMVLPDPRERTERSGLRAPKAMLDPKASKEFRVFRAIPGLRVPLGLRATLAPRVLSDLLEQTVLMVRLALPGIPDPLGRREIRVRPVLTGLRAPMGLPARLGLAALTARSDLKASKASPAFPASKEFRASRVPPVWASPIRAPSIPSMSFPPTPPKATCMLWRLRFRLRRGCGMTPMWRGLTPARCKARKVSRVRRAFRAFRVLPGLTAPLGRKAQSVLRVLLALPLCRLTPGTHRSWVLTAKFSPPQRRLLVFCPLRAGR
jgi:hypothetical protein